MFPHTYFAAHIGKEIFEDKENNSFQAQLYCQETVPIAIKVYYSENGGLHSGMFGSTILRVTGIFKFRRGTFVF